MLLVARPYKTRVSFNEKLNTWDLYTNDSRIKNGENVLVAHCFSNVAASIYGLDFSVLNGVFKDWTVTSPIVNVTKNANERSVVTMIER